MIVVNIVQLIMIPGTSSSTIGTAGAVVAAGSIKYSKFYDKCFVLEVHTSILCIFMYHYNRASLPLSSSCILIYKKKLSGN